MPKIVANGEHLFAYAGKASLLELLDRQQGSFLDVLEEAARHGWITGDRWQDLEVALSHVAVKYAVPQSP